MTHILTDVMGVVVDPVRYQNESIYLMESDGSRFLFDVLNIRETEENKGPLQKVKDFKNQLMERYQTETLSVSVACFVEQMRQGALAEDDPLNKGFSYLMWHLGRDRGFPHGKLHGCFYPDVSPAFDSFKAKGAQISVYSDMYPGDGHKYIREVFRTGLRLQFPVELNPIIASFYDTQEVGPAVDAQSYRNLADRLQTTPGELLYLSNKPNQLDAAAEAGCRVVLVDRINIMAAETRYQRISSFSEVNEL
ncbi:MAG: hypothetical protein WC254_02755 [Candidatus Woesearchaeota archaeon]|jgi:methionine salvage enolase-phosphatase E1